MASTLPFGVPARRIVLSSTAALALLAGSLLLVPSTATAASSDVPALAGNAGFTVLTEGDATWNSTSETEGSWAVGGDLVVQNKYTVMAGGHQAAADRPVVAGIPLRLLVDGGLTMGGGRDSEMVNLSAESYPNVVLGAANTGYTVQPNGRVRAEGGYLIAGSPGIASSEPVAPNAEAFSATFVGTFSRYRALSADLYSATGDGAHEVSVTEGPRNGSNLDGSSLGLTLAADAVNVWNVTPGQLAAMQNGKFNLKFFAGATPSATTPLVINLPAGTTRLDNPSFAEGGNAIAKYVLWNVDTDSLTVTGSRLFSGSLLAPDAHFVFEKSTPLEGQVVAASATVRGSGEIHHIAFIPSLDVNGLDETPVPPVTTPEEPATEEPIDTPSVETPTEETPGDETPGHETPTDETPAEEPPAEQTPIDETPTIETPTEETPTVETPTDDGIDQPAKETPVVRSVAPNLQLPTLALPDSRDGEVRDVQLETLADTGTDPWALALPAALAVLMGGLGIFLLSRTRRADR
ncbi:collagen-binding domain-containing protein [Herbiconiux sp. L3-i23]|uniref:collagen-binding domain-containing protein n=1 Tax=Herbiconiux sp. L3-i23 TaxID=2905871 RepID=UPI002049E5F0|nr:collagen-binding domain-containing protein [Herbiconiux sp. L3-i23]BDI21324.1 hypothetical protein L3i23_01000 [Herbiconiux sp. L3-i23]